MNHAEIIKEKGLERGNVPIRNFSKVRVARAIHFAKQSQKQVRTTCWTRANFDKSSKGPMSCLKAGQLMTSRIPTPLVMPDNNTLFIGYCVWSGLY